jgi:glycosyltransferase involved in cell wall biosynthesis
LVLLGQDGGYTAALAALAERCGLDDAVRILPFEADLGVWWSCADVVVCASESEAMPTAVLEGMAHGLPALATRVGDLPRLIEPGVNGWLCDESDVAALAVALESVALAPPEELTRMGEAAAVAVARTYDPAQATDRWVDLVRSAAAPSGAVV